MSSLRPMPLTDLDSAPWWEAVQHEQLHLQGCLGCERLRWPARAVCNDCGSFDSTWVQALGTGILESWTVTHHSFGPGIETPFVVALVRLDDQDDIRIPGYIDGPADGSELVAGQQVRVGFVTVDTSAGQPLVLVRWACRVE